MGFEGSYLWRLRQEIGSELVVVPAAQVLVMDCDDRLLLIRRSDTGRWGLPAGNAEPHSTFVSSPTSPTSATTRWTRR